MTPLKILKTQQDFENYVKQYGQPSQKEQRLTAKPKLEHLEPLELEVDGRHDEEIREDVFESPCFSSYSIYVDEFKERNKKFYGNKLLKRASEPAEPRFFDCETYLENIAIATAVNIDMEYDNKDREASAIKYAMANLKRLTTDDYSISNISKGLSGLIAKEGTKFAKESKKDFSEALSQGIGKSVDELLQ